MWWYPAFFRFAHVPPRTHGLIPWVRARAHYAQSTSHILFGVRPFMWCTRFRRWRGGVFRFVVFAAAWTIGLAQSLGPHGCLVG